MEQGAWSRVEHHGASDESSTEREGYIQEGKEYTMGNNSRDKDDNGYSSVNTVINNIYIQGKEGERRWRRV